jgi:uncharacterized integral membrane protein (TIGR00698 family)
MASSKFSSLFRSEDWWAVWFGALIIIVALGNFLVESPGFVHEYPLAEKPADLRISGDLAERFSYDAGNKILIYEGRLSPDVRNQLKMLSGDATYKQAVDGLFKGKAKSKKETFLGTAPKLGEWISNPLNQFESYERQYPLVQKPVDLKIEGSLSKHLKYDKNKQALIYKGLMTRAQMQEMKKFSSDPLYQEAVEQLYLTPPVAKGNIIFKLFFLMLSLGFMTAVGVKAMGKNPFEYLGGFIVVFALSVLSYTFAEQHVINAYGLGYAFWALLIGLLISNTIGTPKWLLAGARTEMFIKTGLVLLGAEILFGKILTLGGPGLFVAWLVTPTVIIFMFLFGTRVLKMASKTLTIVIAAATSVCGVSAAIATAAACKAKKQELTLAVGMTLIFTVLMMVFMPIIIKLVGMDKIVGAAWMGGTIDSTGAVVAAGSMLGAEAEKVAAVVKMIQNVLIGVVAFFVALYWVFRVEQDPNAPKPTAMEIWYRFPKFIVGFVGASLLLSFALIPIYGSSYIESNIIGAATKTLRGWLFCLAFVAIGLESNFRDLGSQLVGGKPILLYICGQSFNLVLTLFAAWLAFGGILFGRAF